MGDIREKVIAAKRIGIKELILPEVNRRDFEELPDYVRKGLMVHFAEQCQQVFDGASDSAQSVAPGATERPAKNAERSVGKRAGKSPAK